MIRKYTRLDASPHTLKAIFRDVERWPTWMPGMESLELLEESDSRKLVEVRERLMGRVTTRRLELRFDHEGHTETQVAGRLKRWKTVWRFAEPPTGSGTVISTRIEIDLGMLGYLVSKRRVQRTIDEAYEQLVGRAEARARRREALRVPTVWGVLPGQELKIKVYETPTELEVWFGERRFVVPAAE
jgi:ribosome-associated toxin RatA of RatAB toxin-antitoxin module